MYSTLFYFIFFPFFSYGVYFNIKTWIKCIFLPKKIQDNSYYIKKRMSHPEHYDIQKPLLFYVLLQTPLLFYVLLPHHSYFMFYFNTTLILSYFNTTLKKFQCKPMYSMKNMMQRLLSSKTTHDLIPILPLKITAVIT